MKAYRPKICPVCGVEQAQWGSCGGQGILVAGKTYCCEGCFTRTGCVCPEIKEHAYAMAHSGRSGDEGYLMPAEGSLD